MLLSEVVGIPSRELEGIERMKYLRFTIPRTRRYWLLHTLTTDLIEAFNILPESSKAAEILAGVLEETLKDFNSIWYALRSKNDPTIREDSKLFDKMVKALFKEAGGVREHAQVWEISIDRDPDIAASSISEIEKVKGYWRDSVRIYQERVDDFRWSSKGKYRKPKAWPLEKIFLRRIFLEAKDQAAWDHIIVMANEIGIPVDTLLMRIANQLIAGTILRKELLNALEAATDPEKFAQGLAN